MITKHQIPLQDLTTIKQSGIADTVIIFESESELCEWISTHSTFTVLGKGSNSIINPDTCPTPIVQVAPNYCPSELTQNRLRVSAGLPVSGLMKLLQDHGLSGLEFSAGVPASVGGMVVMNFGCWGQEICDWVARVRVVESDGQAKWMDRSEITFAYRYSDFQDRPCVVTEVELSLSPRHPDAIKSDIATTIRTRLDKQPLRAFTFGSVFKNPEGDFAARLLESAGYKGKHIGPLKFSEQHANFLVNLGGASYSDIKSCLLTAQNAVYAAFGIHLEPEVRDLA